MYQRFMLIGIIAVAATFVGSGEALSAIITTAENATNHGFDASASNSDLANQGQSTFSGFTSSKTPTFGLGLVNDGAASTSTATTSFYRDSEMPSQLTFTLDTSVNTFGYDISTIRSIAGWAGVNQSQANQIWDLSTRKVGFSAFEDHGQFSYTPFGTSGSGDYSTRLTLTDDTGVIAANVEAVRLTIMPIGAGGSTVGTVYREIDVEGLASLTAPPAPPVNLIQNPSFETPALGSGFQQFTGTSQFDATNWPLTGEATIVRGQFGTVASDGAQWLSLESNGSASPNNVASISQTFDTTPGTTYALSFDYNALGNSAVTTPWDLTYDVGGPATVLSIPNPAQLTLGPWLHESTTFVATDATTTLTFLGETKINGFYGPAIDNVAVFSQAAASVPEPSTFALAVLGLLGLALVARRRKR